MHYKGKHRVLSLLLCITVMVSFSAFLSFADDTDTASAEQRKSGNTVNITGYDSLNEKVAVPFEAERLSNKSIVIDDEDGDWIWWNRNDNFVLYRGEKLLIDCTMWGCYTDCYTIPYICVFPDDDSDDVIAEWAPADISLTLDYLYYDDYAGYLDIGSKHLAAGKYFMTICAMPCDVYGWWPYDPFINYDVPMEVVHFTIKDFPKPTKVKLNAGKKRVTVTFKKSAGAQKYEIYRSTKKKSGYKKIATVKTNKYVDKKVKKRKRYYYKVRAVRGTTASGIVRSSFTAPVRSKKVR